MGLKVFIDTNSIIALLNGNDRLREVIDAADEIFISVINELEFKSFSNLSLNDIKVFDAFASDVNVLDLQTSNIIPKNKITEIRNKYKLRLPDAIIAASAIINNAVLVTADKGFKKIEEMQLTIVE